MGLGGVSAVPLADARRRRDEARKAIIEGRDPIAERRLRNDPKQEVLFGAFADQLIPEIVKGFRNQKHIYQWTAALNAHASSLRARPIDAVTTDDVLAVLQPIWTTKSETASRLRGRIERILDAARARGLRQGENPARWRGHLDQLLPRRKRLTRGHHPAMPYADLPGFIAALRKRSGVAARALEFLILTAGRVGEVTGAQLPELDREARLWTVPASRMKAGREHRVPLCDRAIVILDEVAPLRRGSYLFPSFRADRGLSNAAFEAVLTRMKIQGVTSHGFRSSFRDWAGDCTSHSRETVESALAHAVGDATERAYRRGDALAKRRLLMEDWSIYVNGSANRSP
jgi:integrase